VGTELTALTPELPLQPQDEGYKKPLPSFLIQISLSPVFNSLYIIHLSSKALPYPLQPSPSPSRNNKNNNNTLNNTRGKTKTMSPRVIVVGGGCKLPPYLPVSEREKDSSSSIFRLQ
jgi:hypothetical protein